MKNQNSINVIVNHTSRSKAGMSEDFAARKYGEITLGRSTSCTVAFDPDADHMVSRHHATIQALNDGTFRYQIIDEDSTNGVFVNDQKIKGMAVLVPGDKVQLGKKGPEFSFDLSPRPDALLGATRVMSAAAPKATAATTVAPAPTSTKSNLLAQPIVRTSIQVAAGIFLAVILFVGSGFIDGTISPKPSVEPVVANWDTTTVRKPEAPLNMNPAQIAEKFRDAVVYISNSWKLEDAEGKQMFHRYALVSSEGKDYVYPCYVQNNQGQYEPFIESVNYQGYSKPIGHQGGGTGFVVSEDGFIMTNKHVSAPWSHAYSFDQGSFPGLAVNGYGQFLIQPDDNFITVKENNVGTWIPSEAYYGGSSDQKMFEGKMVYQDVVFANRTGRHAARVTRVSDKHDVALLKVDIGTNLTMVDLNDNYSEIKTGSSISILGYPALTPSTERIEASYDAGNTSKIRVAPNLTVNHGMVSALHKGSPTFNSTTLSRSTIGDAYQVDINSAGSGNSGGPMFDAAGRVIGIYTSSNTDYRQTVSFAVPIKYGIELMGL